MSFDLAAVETASGHFCRSPLGSETPTLIAVTGYVGVAQLAVANNAFDHVLSKPVDVDELLRLLKPR